MRAGTPEGLRQANLSIVLAILFRQGPSSRATLARLTSRNRSTIGSLVGDLVAMGLAEEHEPVSGGQVGRPSPVVTLRPDVAALAVNPEIDVLTVSLVGLDGTVLATRRHTHDHIPTAREVVSASAAILDDLRNELPDVSIVGAGGAIPGQVRTSDGVVRNAPHLRWVDEPFAAMLADATGLPVSIANDASLGALAEHDFGAGRGKSTVLYVNGGASGIGGGIVIGDQPMRGAHGYAGEVGHVRVSNSTLVDSAGIPGTLEAMVMRAELLDVLSLAADSDGLDAALRADERPGVRKVVRRQLSHLAVGLAASVNVLNPDVIVLGGFLASLLACDPRRLRDEVARLALPPS
ncbi:MAG: ROK family protein, partial [Micrococcales bacterium]|nr:ROK family protein [Micrococcales bacterium]